MLPAATLPRLAAVLAAVVLAGVAALVVRGAGGDDGPPPEMRVTVPATAPGDEPFVDPFSYDPDRREDFERRAARGFAHPLYARSPGGVTATAARVDRFRPQVERAATAAAVDPDLLEALVFLESAGRPDVVAGGRDFTGAAGLTQILAETGRNLLRMRVDAAAAERLTRQIGRAEARGQLRRAERLRRRRRAVDERFDPDKALAATGRYLTFARRELAGRHDLAFVSYHMGVGNLQGVLAAYGADPDDPPPYAQVYFDSSPRRHAAAHRRLAGFGDESSAYYWKLLAARDVMRRWRTDPAGLERTAERMLAKASAEEVLHPPGSTLLFDRPDTLRLAWDAGDVAAVPDDPVRLGLRRDRRMGELAPRLGQPRSLYRGLRPEALALLLFIAAEVRATAGERSLTVTSAVRDAAYQRLLQRRNAQATRGYSLHTTGWAFDIARRYANRRQALAFQAALDRLRSLDLIAWVREPHAIHVTVSADARAYLPLLDRIQDRP